MKSTSGAMCPVELSTGKTRVNPEIEKHEAALLLLLGFGGFSVLIAVMYNSLRKYVFKDVYNLDTVFDAGGRVSLSMTAVTVTSQCLWPADFLQSSTLISKSGLGGSLWYSLGVVCSILLFPLLTLKLKTRAPGAKTFPQIAYARFGKPAHILFIFIALLTNLMVISGLLLAGKTAIEVLTKDASVEFVMLILAVLFGSYCMIGGLGATFYISYFNTALIFLFICWFILKVHYFALPETSDIASKTAMYEAAVCIKAPEGNFNNSLLTFRSRSGIFYGIVCLFQSICFGLCDQANWQSRIAAKPSQGVAGFLVAAYLWFGIPTSLSFTAAMTYISMSFQNGTFLLDPADVDNGYISPFVMEMTLGTTGGYLMLTVLAMSLMSTGSGEVMSISSIIVYDIFKTYITPFRKGLGLTDCMLCGKDKCKQECNCQLASDCQDCINDSKDKGRKGFGVEYSCGVHGRYRLYEDILIKYKSWCMIWVVILVIPYGLILNESGMNLSWALLSGYTCLSPFLVQVLLTVTWAKTTGKGVIAGGICGMVGCTISMLVVGSTYSGGLSNFYENTSKDYSVIAGLVAGMTIGGVICGITSLCTTTVKTEADEEKEWMKTLSIDNPLHPYRALYAEELAAANAGPNIAANTMAVVFKRTERTAYLGGSISLVLFMVVIPAVALSVEVLTLAQFETLLTFCHVLCFIGLVFVVFSPPIQECIQIYKACKECKTKTMGGKGERYHSIALE